MTENGSRLPDANDLAASPRRAGWQSGREPGRRPHGEPAAGVLRKKPIFEVVTATPRGATQTTAAGLRIGPATRLPAPCKSDLVVVPGGDAATAEELTSWLDARDVRTAAAWLARAAAAGAHVAANCNAVFLLAEAGLLKGQRATTTWWLSPVFRKLHPGTALDLHHMVVPSGQVTTAGAAFAQADLMLSLVRRFGSASLATQCTRYLLLDERLSQTRYAILRHVARQDDFLEKVERWLETHLSRPLDIAALATHMHVSYRTLVRRLQSSVGMSPIRLVQRMRVERALHLLETTRLSFGDIAVRVGYDDAAPLRRLLTRDLGLGPKALRSRVGQAGAAPRC